VLGDAANGELENLAKRIESEGLRRKEGPGFPENLAKRIERGFTSRAGSRCPSTESREEN